MLNYLTVQKVEVLKLFFSLGIRSARLPLFIFRILLFIYWTIVKVCEYCAPSR